MQTVARSERTITRGEGVFVWDDEGRRYIDGSSSLWYANAGHGRSEIAEAIAAQLAEIETFHVFGDFTNRPAHALADRLAALAPSPGSKVFLTSGGGDSIETAVKLARLYHARRGEPSRQHLISRSDGYHGTHGIGTSILGMPFKEGFGSLVAQSSQVAWDSLEALEMEIARIGAHDVAAFLFEPVIGSVGVRVAPPGYLEGVQELCRRHGIVTVADSVIVGFGRIGGWFGVERFGLTPDLIVFAKGVTSGYLPLGGGIVAPHLAAPFWNEPGDSFAHGATYSGHATCCAAALANIAILERDDLVSRARTLEGSFIEQLAALEAHPLIGEVRGGVGLMAAVALDPEWLSGQPGGASRFWSLARDAGVLTRGLFDGVAIAPPLIVESEHIALIVRGLREALDVLARET
jgi:adenosylmethionine-8-amino-7-oxononanoate aminotransferase